MNTSPSINDEQLMASLVSILPLPTLLTPTCLGAFKEKSQITYYFTYNTSLYISNTESIRRNHNHRN